jgi:diguanylate cyclase (GGDEF)-like protein
MIQLRIRASDCFARVAGEEFEIMLPSTGIVGAEVLAQRLSHDLSQASILPDHKVTACFGVAEYRTGDTLNDIRKRLDYAVIEAKKQGVGEVAIRTIPVV